MVLFAFIVRIPSRQSPDLYLVSQAKTLRGSRTLASSSPISVQLIGPAASFLVIAS